MMNRDMASTTLKKYKEAFDEFYQRAQLFPKECFSLEILQKKISNISLEAGNLYFIHKNDNLNDYQARVDIFLKFDEFLKKMKREFKESLPVKTSSCKFHNSKNHIESQNKDNEKFKDTLDF